MQMCCGQFKGENLASAIGVHVHRFFSPSFLTSSFLLSFLPFYTGSPGFSCCGLSARIIAGIVVGCVVFIVIVLCLAGIYEEAEDEDEGEKADEEEKKTR
jgi:hypothetical protein